MRLTFTLTILLVTLALLAPGMTGCAGCNDRPVDDDTVDDPDVDELEEDELDEDDDEDLRLIMHPMLD